MWKTSATLAEEGTAGAWPYSHYPSFNKLSWGWCLSVDSFLSTLSSRLICTLIGNVLAGLVFKVIFT
jgi:hypothetical protein